jgi:hypothetical protein
VEPTGRANARPMINSAIPIASPRTKSKPMVSQALHPSCGLGERDLRRIVCKGAGGAEQPRSLRLRPVRQHRESIMISEIQIHTIARQMLEKHGFEAIAQAAQNAQACERKGDTEDAREWRHIEDAIKIMRGPHHS